MPRLWEGRCPAYSHSLKVRFPMTCSVWTGRREVGAGQVTPLDDDEVKRRAKRR